MTLSIWYRRPSTAFEHWKISGCTRFSDNSNWNKGQMDLHGQWGFVFFSIILRFFLRILHDNSGVFWMIQPTMFIFIRNIYPICSMYGIFTNIFPKNQPNVGKYSIHGAYGYIYIYIIGCRFDITCWCVR